jgi:TolA-binding protein
MSRSVCTWTEREEVFEAYVRDTLSSEDRDAFEAHYFECEICSKKVQTYQAMRDELAALPAEAHAAQPAAGWPWRWVLVPLAGSLVLAAAAALWFGAPSPAPPESTVATAPATQQTVVEPPAGPTSPRVPSSLSPWSPGSSDPGKSPASTKEEPARPALLAPPPVVALSVLARVEPPVYIPAALRGLRDEAAERFDAAMRRYVDGDYAGAIPGLQGAAELRPGAPQTAFFLAVCHLLTAQVDAAAAGFERVIALGESPYLEEAHFYLAKARIRQGRVPDARDELRQTIALRGRLAQDARRLLTQLDALQAK